MRKKFRTGLVFVGMATMLAGCGQNAATATTAAAETTTAAVTEQAAEKETTVAAEAEQGAQIEGAVNIMLSDDGITVDGEAISENAEDAVYAANDIVYYEEGKDFKYGEGTEADEHSKEEADAHTVIHITKPGTYAVSGKISAGQIAVDLGKEAEEDPEAVVTLILNGVDITSTVAPAILVYNVYECGPTEEETAVKDVDTTTAGMNLVIADGTENHVSGSYVARIYKSIELNEDGTKVVDSKKLHKYDGAIQAKMSMNVTGGEEGTGILNIQAENEGLGSEYHLTINGGNINIVSGNDGINTSEDYVSVTTINDGTVKIRVDGTTGEGDGIDSNGWLVINGGTVISEGCSFSMDAGIDSDLGIHINGGTVIATGNMLDHISESEQNYAVFTFADKLESGETVTLKDPEGNEVISYLPENSFTYLIFSDADMEDGTYSLWAGDTQLFGAEGEGMGGFQGMPGGFNPGNFDPNNMPEGMTPPADGQAPQGGGPNGGGFGGRPGNDGFGGGRGDRENRGQEPDAEVSAEFAISAGGSYFSSVGAAK
ncbi:MAG: carbohydrate-binding domain-containing protein [Lachnoclostridium sp.]|nr:carbohydrate-binding domain-containing protein [Lachnoclostridium sp.]